MDDLLVIGAGLTGLVAAYTAARAGRRVSVIAKGLGATHWTAGTVDVLGYYPNESSPVQRPLAAIAALATAHPDHPYALAGQDGLVGGLHTFVEMARSLGLSYGSAANGEAAVQQPNLWLPSPAGVPRPAYLAPHAQLAGDLSRPEPILIVGFQGLRDFFPEMVAANLEKTGHPARAGWLPMDLLTHQRDRNNIQLARGLDDLARVRALGAALRRLVRPGERIGLPALLGFERHGQVVEAITSAAGAPVFEIPTLPPSVPGMRLDNALRRELMRLGVRVDVNMAVIDRGSENGRLTWVATETSHRPLVHRAERFLLATGGILGGGINTDFAGHVRETVLDLPVTAPNGRSAWFHSRFMDPDGQPIFRCGVRVNAAFRPVDSTDTPVYSNVFAAGMLLANADPIRERSLEGLAVATGTAAARQALI